MQIDTPSPVLEVSNVRKLYPISGGLRQFLRQQGSSFVHALDGISFRLERGEILGVVGESGSGKSTTALSVLGLINPTEGHIMFDGQDVNQMVRSRDRMKLRRQVQMIFQDPYEALNPRQTVYEIVAEPLEVHHIVRTKEEKTERVKIALLQAGLKPPENYLKRYPGELSGGQRQRVVIAGALVLQPKLLVADEPVSMLDVSIRAEILNLLRQLRDEHGISILYITHDLATAGFFTDRIAVMYLGRIVEIGKTSEVLKDPIHPYTRALISVIPTTKQDRKQKRVILQGEIPNPVDIPSGCRFHPRCPAAIDQCRDVDPQLDVKNGRHPVACIRADET
ncbi:MAG: ABC transporter ATP-binding protein [Anaerolineae bacterium]